MPFKGLQHAFFHQSIPGMPSLWKKAGLVATLLEVCVSCYLSLHMWHCFMRSFQVTFKQCFPHFCVGRGIKVVKWMEEREDGLGRSRRRKGTTEHYYLKVSCFLPHFPYFYVFLNSSFYKLHNSPSLSQKLGFPM